MTDALHQGDIAHLWRRLRQSAVEPLTWIDLARAYAKRDLPWQTSYAARQALRLNSDSASRLKDLDLGARQETDGGEAVLGGGTFPEAQMLARRVAACLNRCDGDWLTALYLARLLEMAAAPAAPNAPFPAPGTLPTAEQALQQARALEFMPGESLHWMGVWRLSAGDAQGAVAALSGLLGLDSPRHGSMMYLGEALLRLGRVAAAEKAFERASHSTNPDFLLTLSARAYGCNYWQEAIAVLKKALALKPSDVPTLLAMAKIQSEVYALADCRETLRQVRQIAPDNAEMRLLEAGLQGRIGDAKGHLVLQQAYDDGGDPRSRLASSIAMTSLYHDALPPAEVMDLHRRMCAPIEAGLVPKRAFGNARALGQRLRVGIVTGDLHRQHPVNIFMLPMLLHFDRSRLEICVYYSGTMQDEYTRQARAHADRWLDVATLDDAALQRAICGDAIDVLIDLAGHTSSHRLGVFAMRAAPVQATFLGYPHSTGLTEMDWLIGDATVSPAAHAHLFSEGLAQLPHSVFCWAPLEDYQLPDPRPPGAPVVFGSFNNAMKLSPLTVELWARVLQAAPLARLLLKAPSLRDAEVRARFLALFAAHGIAPQRLMFRGPSGLHEMMQEYGDIDVALDPTPYNGGTTTLQALWMGVPVVTLEGGNFVGRMGASFMRALGEPGWVANDGDGYVRTAMRLAASCAALRTGRTQMRARMAASTLCDIRAYVAHFEALLQRMWACYGAGERPPLIRAVGNCEGSSGLESASAAINSTGNIPVAQPREPCNSRSMHDA